MKKNNYVFTVVLILMTSMVFGQVQKAKTLQVGDISSNSQNASAALQIDDTNRGLLPPRLTSIQRNAIVSPAVGLTIYNTTTNCIEWYNGLGWYNACGGSFISNTSGGSSVVSAYSCSTASSGSMTAGTAVSGVTQTITATVTTAGTYAISTTANGVTFAGSGTFTGTGSQAIVLTATGTPTTAGNNISFSLNTTPNCAFSRLCAVANQTVITDITSTTGKIWMDRNLGASRVAQSATDYLAYGQLYQWGRGNDGHADVNWTSATTGTAVNGTTTTLSTTDNPGNNLYITNSNLPYNWRTSTNDNLWQGVSGSNNPCPAGYRIPTRTELTNEVTTYSITNTATAFSSLFKFPAAGYRGSGDGVIASIGVIGQYWTSTVSGNYAYRRIFNATSTLDNSNGFRAVGESIRCIKN